MPVSYEEGHGIYTRAYNNAVYTQSVKQQCEANVTAYNGLISSANQSIRQDNAAKKDLEQRLSEVKAIIALLDGKLSQAISTANRTAARADGDYREAITLKQGAAAARLDQAFASKGVMENADSCAAYESCRQERQRIETAIAALEAEIRKLNASIAQYNASIRSLNGTIAQCSTSLRAYNNTMADYYAYRSYPAFCAKYGG